MVKKNNKNLFFNIGFALATILIVVIFYKSILLTTALILAVAIIGLIKWKSRRTLYIFLIVSIFGALAEMACIYFGVWEYSFTDFFNIPTWLFIVWGNAAVFIYQLSLEIKERRLKL